MDESTLDQNLGPRSWRDVYDLVRDTRADLKSSIAENKAAISGLDAKFDTHLLVLSLHAGLQAGRRAMRDDIFGVTRGTLALVFAAVASLVSAATAMHII